MVLARPAQPRQCDQMIVHPRHLEFDFGKRQKMEAELAELVEQGEIGEQDANELAEGSGEPFFTETPEFCFVCGHALSMPSIMWHGHHGTARDNLDIWMHPKCAESLSRRLLRDTDELKLGKAKADLILDEWEKGQGEG